MSSAQASQFGTPRLDFFEAASTLDIARELAKRGVPHGTLVTAAHQTAGRGRRGASWHDVPGASALMTFVLRPGNALTAEDAWRIGFIASLACVRALRGLGVEQAQVKWPNDLVIGDSKVGGLLVESARVADETIYLLGIGINVAQSVTDFSDGGLNFALQPTSVRLALGNEKVNSSQVIATVAEQLGLAWSQHAANGEGLIAAWRGLQITGHEQSGLDLATGKAARGTYQDVRGVDGAGLIEIAGGMRIAVAPLTGSGG